MGYRAHIKIGKMIEAKFYGPSLDDIAPEVFRYAHQYLEDFQEREAKTMSITIQKEPTND